MFRKDGNKSDEVGSEAAATGTGRSSAFRLVNSKALSVI